MVLINKQFTAYCTISYNTLYWNWLINQILYVLHKRCENECLLVKYSLQISG
jgi:hypothetical protein